MGHALGYTEVIASCASMSSLANPRYPSRSGTVKPSPPIPGDRNLRGVGPTTPPGSTFLCNLSPSVDSRIQNRRPRPDHGDGKFDRPFSISELSEPAERVRRSVVKGRQTLLVVTTVRDLALRRAMLPERRTGTTLGDMQLRSHLLNAGPATRGA